MTDQLTACPCGGELRVLVTAKQSYHMDGTAKVLHEDEAIALWCVACEDWADGGRPSGVTADQVTETLTAWEARR